MLLPERVAQFMVCHPFLLVGQALRLMPLGARAGGNAGRAV